MKTVYITFAFVLSIFVAQAQSTPTPGTTQQAISTPLYVFNNNVAGHNLQFEPRTHNYADYYQPICYTFVHSLAAGSSIVFADPTQVGVPLHLFGSGNVLSIHQDLWPTNHYYTLMSPTDFFDYGTTQKWHEIKFQLDNTSLAGNLRYPYNPALPIVASNSLWEMDSNNEIWHVDPAYSSNLPLGGYTAVWNVVSGMNLISVF